MQITTLENIFLGLALIFLAIYLFILLVQSKPKWFLSKTLLKCRQFEQKYQRIKAARRDLLHHYYWAKSEKQEKKMKKIEKDIIKYDQQLQEMRQMYNKIRAGLPIPLKLL